MRVLVLSASVGEGHDAASQALAEQLRRRGVRVDVIDGLAVLGPRLERFVLRGYRLQLRHAVWSWAALYTVTRSRLFWRGIGFLFAVYGGTRLLEQIREHDADRVVSVYPIVSAALASLRRRGRLPVVCASLITDFDPHPAWWHPDLDANLSVVAGPRTMSIAPPLRNVNEAERTPAEIRRQLGIPQGQRVAIIAGGAWGIGNLRGAATTIASIPGFHALVVTGRNEPLRSRLADELQGRSATVLGYVDGLAGLLAAADVVVQHAGGVTCLEAFAAERPVVMFDPLPGHGKRNARRMQKAGVSTTATRKRALRRMLASPTYWATTAPASVAAGLALFAHPSAATALTEVDPNGRHASSRIPRPAWVLIGLSVALLAAVTLATLLVDPTSASWAVASWDGLAGPA